MLLSVCIFLRRGVLAAALAFVLAAGISMAPESAAAQIGEDEVAARIKSDYKVEVLRVRPGEVDGVPVWLVTVMTPGGNFNDAFQVTTLAVDRASGALVPAYRHGLHGAMGLGDAVDTKIERRPSQMRSRTWR